MRTVKACAVLLAAAATLTGACTSGAVINNDDVAAPRPVTTTTPPPQFGTANLVDASSFLIKSEGRSGYYFTTPSGRWNCAIVPHEQAGCELAAGLSAGTGIATAPTEVPDGSGATARPNAITVDREHDARFVALGSPVFSASTAPVLPFGKVLAVAGFRCNVQEETGVSCVRELTGKGFTFSGDDFALRYTDVP